MTTNVDIRGNRHRPAGSTRGGQFSEKTNSAPADQLSDPAPSTPLLPLAQRFESVEEKLKVMQSELERSVEALSDDDQWLAYLKMMGRFHRYSFNNQLLIGVQRPDATRVAGFNTWKSLGRSVRKGERGIAILAPKVVNAKDENGAPELDANGKPVRRVVGFTATTVFDVSQTEGEELPTAHEALTEEPPAGYIDDLTAAITSHGYSVTYEPISGGAHAYTATDGSHRVVVDESLGEGDRATALAHELGHIVCGHTDQMDDYHTGHGGHRGRMEVEAESFAFVLSRANGMQTHLRGASEYVAGWQSKEPGALREVGETIAKATKSVLTGTQWRNAGEIL